MTVRIREGTHFGWKCLFLEAGNISVGVAPEIGGRIISFNFNRFELLFVQDEHAGETFDFSGTVDLRAKKLELGHRLWGGDKTWVAPQSAWGEGVPPLELDAGRYEAKRGNNFIFMRSPICRETGLRIERKVSLNDDGVLWLEESFINESNKPMRRGIWNVTQCVRPLDVYLPVHKNELRAYREEGNSVELFCEVVFAENDWSVVKCREALHFKYGGIAKKGIIFAVRGLNRSKLVFAKFFETDPMANYAHGSSVEVYNSPTYNYLEIEVHAPIMELGPGEKQTQRQKWHVKLFESDVSIKEILEWTKKL